MLIFNSAGSVMDEGALPITSHVNPDPAPEEWPAREPGRPQPVPPEQVPPDPAPAPRPDPTDPAPGPQRPDIPVVDPPHEPVVPELRMGQRAL